MEMGILGSCYIETMESGEQISYAPCWSLQGGCWGGGVGVETTSSNADVEHQRY